MYWQERSDWSPLSSVGQQRSPSTMPARCLFRGCGKWEFQDGLCKTCQQSPDAPKIVYIAQNLDALRAQGAVRVLVCMGNSPNPSHIALNEGDYVDILQEATAGEFLVRTQAGNPMDRKVGFYPEQMLLTEEQVYTQFMADEDARLAAEIEAKKTQQDTAAEEYEAQLRKNMFHKAEQDRKQRGIDAENRKLEAERMQRELEARRLAEAEQQKIYAAERQAEIQEKARQTAVLEKARIDDARRNKAEWDKKDERMKDDEYLRKLPAWKREMVLAKRAQERSADPNLSGVFPGSAPY